jgi:hypothetical protein
LAGNRNPVIMPKKADGFHKSGMATIRPDDFHHS